jgi:uncharacterized protein YqgC (DUF456 family)
LDIFLIIFGSVLVIAGIAGSVLPVLPGPLTGWFGLLCIYLSSWVPINYYTLSITFALSIAILVLDYVIPSLGAKRYGGSKKGVTGATLGMLIGLVAPIPLGFVIGAFAGAFVGELIHKRNDLKRAWRSAVGSFLGFLTSTGLKLLVSLFFLVYYGYLVMTYWP